MPGGVPESLPQPANRVKTKVTKKTFAEIKNPDPRSRARFVSSVVKLKNPN